MNASLKRSRSSLRTPPSCTWIIDAWLNAASSALANLRQHIAAEDWWFSIWQPPLVAGIDRVVTADWLLQPC